jgi:hypothetical protein
VVSSHAREDRALFWITAPKVVHHVVPAAWDGFQFTGHFGAGISGVESNGIHLVDKSAESSQFQRTIRVERDADPQVRVGYVVPVTIIESFDDMTDWWAIHVVDKQGLSHWPTIVSGFTELNGLSGRGIDGDFDRSPRGFLSDESPR